MPDKLSTTEFAARIKQRDSRLTSVPDEELVRKVLERRPELMTFLTATPSAPTAPGKLTEPNPFLTRVLDRVSQAAEGTAQMVPKFLEESRGRFKGAQEKGDFGGMALAPLRAERSALGDVGKGIYSVTTPGLVQRIAAKEDPANIAADAAMMMLPSGESPVRGALEGGAKTVAKGFETPTRVTLQRLSGAGKEPVLLEAMKRKEAMAKELAQHADKVAEARQQAAVAETQTKYGDQLRENFQKTYQTVKSRLDARWNGMRSTPTRSGGGLSILKDELGNAKDLRDGMEIAERKFLQGSPESLKQFRDLTGWIERGKGAVGDEGVPSVTTGRLTPPTWEEMRTHYSNMGDALYGREIPSNVFRALKYVRDEVVGRQLHDMATKAGVGEQYGELLKDHSQFENDWKNMSSVTRAGGSPLAVARMAPNSATLIPQITGKTGDLLIERLAKYQDAGASPATATAIRKLGKVSVSKEPVAPKPRPPIDPVAIRRAKMLQYSGKPKRYYDYLPPNFPAEQLLSIDAIREWVARQPRKELPVR